MNERMHLKVVEPVQASEPDAKPAEETEQVPYAQDAFERWILLLDTLRERADNMIAHDRQGMPPLLDFDYELLLDAREFDRPANYALLRITRVGDDCWDDCMDEAKPPVIIVDPRAGHGPGIGGFKHDSEVGMAMHEGHPVYFVVFFPEPMPGQTLADVHHALRGFVTEVARRHPDTPPILYGNCQAGWAVTLLATDCKGLTGPVVLNGSAALISLISAAPSAAAANVQDETTADVLEDVGDDLADATDSVIGDYLSIGPVIYVDQGARVTVMVDRDLEIF